MKKTFLWLQNQSVNYNFRDFKKEPLHSDELSKLVHKIGLHTLVNKRGMTWRSLGLNVKKVTDDQLFGLLLENQTMIKRPLIISDKQISVGFDENQLKNIL